MLGIVATGDGCCGIVAAIATAAADGGVTISGATNGSAIYAGAGAGGATGMIGNDSVMAG